MRRFQTSARCEKVFSQQLNKLQPTWYFEKSRSWIDHGSLAGTQAPPHDLIEHDTLMPRPAPVIGICAMW